MEFLVGKIVNNGQRVTLRLPEALRLGVEQAAALSEMGPSEWMRNALELQAANDIGAHQRMETQRRKTEAVTTPERCVHPKQYLKQGVFSKYCGFCGEDRP